MIKLCIDIIVKCKQKSDEFCSLSGLNGYYNGVIHVTNAECQIEMRNSAEARCKSLLQALDLNRSIHANPLGNSACDEFIIAAVKCTLKKF